MTIFQVSRTELFFKFHSKKESHSLIYHRANIKDGNLKSKWLKIGKITSNQKHDFPTDSI